MITHHPIEWWVEKFKEPFSLARFGDGEFLCVEDRQGANSHGCNYTPQLKADLVAILEDTSTNFLKGMQRILPSQLKRIRALLKGDWVDTEIFGDAIAAGKFKPIFDVLREKELVIISSAEKRNIPLPYAHFIEVPRTNAHEYKDFVLHQVMKWGKPSVYLFACGMAAGTFVHALHGKIPGASFIDIGHVFDPFVGEMSREYLAAVDPATLKKNL